MTESILPENPLAPTAISVAAIPVVTPTPPAPPIAHGAAPARASRIHIVRDRPVETAKKFISWISDGIGKPTLYYQDGDYWLWNGKFYARLDERDISSKAYAFFEICDESAGKNKVKKFHAKARDVHLLSHALAAVVVKVGNTAPLWVDGRKSPRAVNILPCENGLVDLRTLTLIPHTPDFFCDNHVPYDFDPNCAAPAHWLKFLNDIWPDDPESIDTLHEIMGYLLTCDTDHQKIFSIIGPKRSGKSTIAQITQAMLGNSNIATPTFFTISESFGLQPLIHKRAAIITDARLSSRLDGPQIVERLLSISGEDVQTVNRKFKPAWMGRLFARFLIVSNELLKLPDPSGALPSRLIVLKTTRSFFGAEDHFLRDKLTSELPGILNLAITGLQRLTERGYFVQPTSATYMLDAMMEIASPISMFVKDFCEVQPEHVIDSGELYDAWRSWRESEGILSIETKPIFSQQLHALISTVKTEQRRIPTKTQPNRRVRMFCGITLKSKLLQSVTGVTRDSLLNLVKTEN